MLAGNAWWSGWALSNSWLLSVLVTLHVIFLAKAKHLSLTFFKEVSLFQPRARSVHCSYRGGNASPLEGTHPWTSWHGASGRLQDSHFSSCSQLTSASYPLIIAVSLYHQSFLSHFFFQYGSFGRALCGELPFFTLLQCVGIACLSLEAGSCMRPKFAFSK